MGSVPMGALPTGEIPMGSVPVGSIPIGAIPVGSMPTGSMSVGSLPIGEVPMGTLPIDLPPPPPLGFDVPPELPAGSMPLGTPLPPDLPADVPAVTAVDLLPPTAPTMGTSKPAASAPRSSSSSRAPSDQPKPRPTHQRPQRIETPPPAPEFVSPLPDPTASISPAPITPPAQSTVVPVLPTTAPVPGVPGAAALDPMAPLGSITQPLEKPADEPQRDPGEIVDTRQKVKLVGTGVQQRELRKLSPAEKARRSKSRTIVTLIFCITILLLTMVFVMWREAIEKRDAEKGTEMLQRAVEHQPRG